MEEIRTRPSFAHVWAYCPGAVQMSAPVPNDGTVSTIEGDAAHWLNVQLIAGHDIERIEFDDKFTPITDDMRRGAYLWRDTVASWMEGAYFEFPVRPTPGGRLPARAWGTPDAWRYRNLELRVGDYKYGFRSVSVYENLQLISYAANILDSIGELDFDIKVIFEVVQPRDYTAAGQVKRWECKASDLRGLINHLAMRSNEAAAHNPQLKPGQYCCDCPGRARCPALREAGFAALDFVRGFTEAELNPSQIGFELELLERYEDLFSARKAGLQAQAESLLRAGQRVPGYEMAAGRPSTVWTAPPDVVQTVCNLAGYDVTKPADLITPIQAMNERKIPEYILKGMYTKRSGALKLARQNFDEAKRIFGNG